MADYDPRWHTRGDLLRSVLNIKNCVEIKSHGYIDSVGQISCICSAYWPPQGRRNPHQPWDEMPGGENNFWGRSLMLQMLQVLVTVNKFLKKKLKLLCWKLLKRSVRLRQYRIEAWHQFLGREGRNQPLLLQHLWQWRRPWRRRIITSVLFARCVVGSSVRPSVRCGGNLLRELLSDSCGNIQIVQFFREGESSR